MRSIEDLSIAERAALDMLRTRLCQQFPHWQFRMTLFGSRARGEAEPDSDMDVLMEIETDVVTFPQKQQIRRIAGDVSIETGLILSLLTVDRAVKRERGDYAIFQTIQEEGIRV